MVTAMIGRINEYCPESELLSLYLKRVNAFFSANEINDKKKVPVFLGLIGSKIYSILKNLVAPKLPRENTFEQLVAALKEHFEPKPLVIMERFHFHRQEQVEEESINECMAELCRLTTHSKFGAFLDKALRDRLVCGLRNEGIQKKLLTEADLTLVRAIELAEGMKKAEKNAKSLKGMESAIKSITPAKACHRCGQSSHKSKTTNSRITNATVVENVVT